MSLLYLDDIGLSEQSVDALREYAVFDIVEGQLMQCWINEFETAVYSADAETLTAEKLNDMSLQCAGLYGIDGWEIDISLDWAYIEHIFAYPMYTISYCVSADAAVQLYAMESAESGSGMSVYMDGVKGNSQNSYFDNLTRIGLKLPFETDSVKNYVASIEKCLDN